MKGKVVDFTEKVFEIVEPLDIEAVRGGAGIGILHKFIAQQDPALVQVLPEITLERSYWLVVHEDMRTIARLNAVTNFIVEQVAASTLLFGRH